MQNVRRGIKSGQIHRYPAHPYVLLTHILYTESSWLFEFDNGTLCMNIKECVKVTRIRQEIITKAMEYLEVLGFITELIHPSKSGTFVFKLAKPKRGQVHGQRTI
jgi:hypothetical protein